MALEVTADRVDAAARRLGGEDLWFTARQLYYEVCRDLEVPHVRMAPTELSLGALAVLLGMIVGSLVHQAVVVLALVGIGAMLVAVGAVTHVTERRPRSRTRPLALSYAAFAAGPLLTCTHPRLLADRAGGNVGAAGAVEARASGPIVVACDEAWNAAMVQANAGALSAPVVVAVAADLAVRRDTVGYLAVHDCSPAGCAVLPVLREQGCAIVDVALAPTEVMQWPFQVLEGAPARLPRELSNDYEVAAVDWLRSGRRVELAVLTPRELVDRLNAAINMLAVP